MPECIENFEMLHFNTLQILNPDDTGQLHIESHFTKSGRTHYVYPLGSAVHLARKE